MQTEHEEQVLQTGVDVLLAADVVYGDKVSRVPLRARETYPRQQAENRFPFLPHPPSVRACMGPARLPRPPPTFRYPSGATGARMA